MASMLASLGRVGVNGGRVVGIVLCVLASHAWGQEPPPGGAQAQPPIAAYPLELLGLLAPPAQRGPATVTPSIAVSEEYNDNLFFDNRNRQWDLITGLSPSLTLFVTRPSYQLSGGSSFTAEMSDRNARLNNALEHQNFVAIR